MLKTYQTIRLSDVRPNPFRNLEDFPLNVRVIADLMNSIKQVGFITRLMVRPRESGYDLAYGHHRLEAAKSAGLTELEFVVADLSDADMLKIMVLDNRADLQFTDIARYRLAFASGQPLDFLDAEKVALLKQAFDLVQNKTLYMEQLEVTTGWIDLQGLVEGRPTSAQINALPEAVRVARALACRRRW